MKTFLNLIIASCFFLNNVYSQSLSQRAKNNFCLETYYQYSVIRSGIYQAMITRHFSGKSLSRMEIDEIFETSSKNIRSFNLLVRATYNICGGSSQYLYLHLHDFLRLSVADSKELIPYILATGEMINSNPIERSLTKVPLRRILEDYKWFCIGMYYQRNGVGDAFDKNSEYLTKFNKNDKSFIISNPNISYKGSYQFIDKDSILVCKGYEDGIKNDAKFKVSFKDSKLILEQMQENDESCYHYEFEEW